MSKARPVHTLEISLLLHHLIEPDPSLHPLLVYVPLFQTPPPRGLSVVANEVEFGATITFRMIFVALFPSQPTGETA